MSETFKSETAGTHRQALLEIANGLCTNDDVEGRTTKETVAKYTGITERRGPVRISPVASSTLDSFEHVVVEQGGDALFRDIGAQLVGARGNQVARRGVDDHLEQPCI